MREGMGIFKGFSFILLPFVLLSILASSENIDVLSNETLSNETLNNETLINETLINETLSDDVPSNETLSNDTLSNEILTNDTLINDTLINDTLINDTLINDTLTNETLVNEILNDDETSNDVLSNDTLINDTLINDTLINDTLINDTLINDTLMNEIPSSDKLSNETLNNETLINETLINETLINETLSDETQINETPSNETLINETLINETLVTEIPSNEPYEINVTSVNVLKWIDTSDNEERFEVWRSDNGGEYTQIGEVSRTPEQSEATGDIVTFDDANWVVGHMYTYYVISINVKGSSIPSDIATVGSSVPLAPSGLTGAAVKSEPRYTVTLSWIDNANNENGFQIQRSIATSFQSPTTYSVGADVTTFTDEQVPSYRRGYYYRVRAINALGNSGWSDVLHVNTT